jgi:hypothetical protein
VTRADHRYSLEFLRELVSWSRWVALATALFGGALTRDIGFALTCGIAAAIDIWMLEAIEGRSRHSLESGSSPGPTYGTLAVLIGARLAVKSLLLVAAVMFPNLLSFWGMVAGVLVVDTTVLLVGGPVAALRTFQQQRQA